MAFNHQDWNRKFIDDPNYNDAVNYGVSIFRHNPVSGERYWRIIGIHHLFPGENRGGHHLLFDALDINGNRVQQIAWVAWKWKDMRPEEQPPFAQGDKPPSEPMGNIALGWNQIVDAKCNGRNTTQGTDGNSDEIKGIHTNHPDEGDAEGNTRGHHSFYVVFKETIAGEVVPDPDPEPTPDPQPDPTPDPQPDPKPIPDPAPNPGPYPAWPTPQQMQMKITVAANKAWLMALPKDDFGQISFFLMTVTVDKEWVNTLVPDGDGDVHFVAPITRPGV